jgi:hypothetical protein
MTPSAVELFVTLIVSCFPACVCFYKTVLRDSRVVKSIKFHVPSILFREYGSTQVTARSGTDAGWHGSKHGLRSAKAQRTEQRQTESEARSAGIGIGNSPTFALETDAGFEKTAQRPMLMGEIIKSIDVDVR